MGDSDFTAHGAESRGMEKKRHTVLLLTQNGFTLRRIDLNSTLHSARFSRERNEDTRAETERPETEGQGGGAAECHPVIRELSPLVHRSSTAE